MKIRTGRVFIIFGVIMFILLVAVILSSAMKTYWQAPLGPGLGFDELPLPSQTLPSDPTSQPEAETLPPAETTAPAETPSPDTEAEDDPTAVTLPTYTPNPYCGDDSEMLILAIGIDYRRGTYVYGLADVIRLVKVDFITPSVSVLAMPRDLWVEVPGISDHYNITHSKLNQSYFYGTPAMGYYDGPGGGAGLLARTLSLNYGVQPEHYGVVNMIVLEDMINAIGGVDIYLSQGIDARDTPESEDKWKIYDAGWNHLNGRRAVYYARIRKIDGGFGRMDRQTEILCAVKNKLLSPSSIMGIPDMITAFSDNVLTDLSPAQLAQLACLAPNLKTENITFARLPESELHGTSMYNPNMKINDFVWEVDNQAIRNYISGFLDGTWPPPPDENAPSNTNKGETQSLCPVYPGQ